MYEYEKKTDDNVNFESNRTEKGKRKDEGVVSKRQDARFVQKIRKPIQENVIQRIGEEGLIAYDEDVLAVMRGNVRSDIIATKGKSYFLVQQIPNIIDEIIENLYILCKDANMYGSMGRDAEQILDNPELRPFIHALVVKYLKVGNCLDFSKLVFSKLVERNYGKWVYQCYLDKKEIYVRRDDQFFITVRCKEKDSFDILNPSTYSVAEIYFKGKNIPFDEYVHGNNPTGYPLEEIDSAIYLKNKKLQDGSVQMKYMISTLRSRQKNAYDHAFVITYPDEVNTVSDMDIRKAMVVDAWGGLSPRTLQAFLNYGNPYKADLDTQDIKISVKQQSQGNPFSFPKIEQMVQVIVAKYARGVKRTDPEVQDIYQQARSGQEIDRVYG